MSFSHFSTQLHEVQKRIGYCPQFDAIIDLLTGRELLTMFARLRGIPEKHIKNAVQFEIERLDLVKHANKRCGNYRYLHMYSVVQLFHIHVHVVWITYVLHYNYMYCYKKYMYNMTCKVMTGLTLCCK